MGRTSTKVKIPGTDRLIKKLTFSISRALLGGSILNAVVGFVMIIIMILTVILVNRQLDLANKQLDLAQTQYEINQAMLREQIIRGCKYDYDDYLFVLNKKRGYCKDLSESYQEKIKDPNY